MQRRITSIPLLAAGAALVLAPLFAPASAHADDKKAIQAQTSAFYRWYVGELNRDRHPIENRAMMRRSISRRLAKWIASPAYREYGADYFVQAQDFDPDWTRVRTSNFRHSGSSATLTAILGKRKAPEQGIGERKLKLKWVREGGVWKLDRVDDPERP
jgi:hypothetical protein